MDIEAHNNQIVSLKVEIEHLKMNIAYTWCIMVVVLVIIAILVTAMLSYVLEKTRVN